MYVLNHQDSDKSIRVSGWVFWPSAVSSATIPLLYMAWAIWVLALNGFAAEHYLGLSLWISLPVLAALTLRTDKFQVLPKRLRIVVSLIFLAIAMWYQVDVGRYSYVGLAVFAMPPLLMPLFMKGQKAWYHFLCKRFAQATQKTDNQS